jgi:methylated-DNA-[protein]-cysteine S-methyltransferase
MTVRYTIVPSPIDDLLLTSERDALTRLHMTPHTDRHGVQPDWVRDDDDLVLAEARRQLDAYFAGELSAFDLPLDPAGTAFQVQVWHQLTCIPYGHTISYGELARRIANPSASRAVGLANGRNPIAVIVPCHRVIGADGSLTGFGGGLDRKRALLSLEQGVQTLPV